MTKRLLSSTATLLGFMAFSLLNAQVADFNANKISGCSPLIVTFTDASTGGGANPTWSWNFGNGNVATGVGPQTATYSNAGTYTVTLKYTNTTTGASNTKTKTAYITVFANPLSKFSASDTVGCFPLTVNFTDLSTIGTGAINKWAWDFGDGSPLGTTQNVSHTYIAAGNYKVTLTVTDVNGCQNTLSKVAYIKVSSSNLIPAFTFSPAIGCKAPSTINFTNTTSGSGPFTYKWAFGDTNTSTTTNPSNTYLASGTYTVTLTAKTSGGCSKTSTSTITVLGASNVAFGASDSSVCPGSTIAFTDKTSPSPGSWKWDFGDGSTSVLQNPSHLYPTAGTYTVKLKVVFGGICPDSVTKVAYIKVNPKPAISFTADTTHACSVPFSVKFTDNTPGAADWKWSFGDGNTATTQNPTNIYNNEGDFNVKLIVTTAAGCKDSLTKSTYIKVHKPVANFTTSPNPAEGCVPLTVNFTDLSTSIETITSWLWDFGDPASGASNTSTSKNPTHTYTRGDYDVTLTITNSYGCKSTLKIPAKVRVRDKPVPDFFAAPLNSCALTPVTFDGTASDSATVWIWNFGDGQTGGGSTTTHLYSDTGLFTIRLIVKNIGCPDTLIKTQYIHISPAVPKFTVATSCTPVLMRTFTNSSLGADKWYWNFGDGSPVDSVNGGPTSPLNKVSHTFPAAGTYTVKLTAKNNSSGCKKDTTLKVTLVDLIPKFSILPKQGCKPVAVSFADKTVLGVGGSIQSYSWNFGDPASGASNTSTISNPSHTYTTPGLYTIKFYVTDNTFGCKDSLIKVDSVKVFDITPDFYVKKLAGCDSLQVFFRDTSQTNPVSTAWAWSFGDGKTSTQQHPNHYYTAPGTYNVSLTVTNLDGSCSVTKNNIVVFVKPSAVFTSNTQLTCPGSTVTFSNTSGNTNKYTWDFGDPASGVNNTSVLKNPTHIYAGNGSYTVKLTATDSITGCSSILTKTNYIVIDRPVAGFKTSAFASTCPPLTVTFVDTSVSVSAITSRYWDFGDGNIAPLVLNDTATNTYTAAGKYTVKLIVTNAAGCKDSVIKVKLITVNGPSGSYTFTPNAGCIPFNVDFTLVTFNTKTDSLDFGDGNLYVGDTCCISHTYSIQGVKTPFLTLIDTAGCRWLVPPIGSVTVSPYPAANFTYVPQYPKAGVSIQFTDQSAAGNTWNWDFGDNKGTSTAKNPTYSFAKSGIYYVKEIVDNNGCIDSITREIIIIEDLVIPNVFTPNNDGINETFTLRAFGVKQLDVHIYDRWGLEVYSKVAEKIFWDGRTNAGLEVPTGTYYYIIKAQTITGLSQSYKGFLEVLR